MALVNDVCISCVAKAFANRDVQIICQLSICLFLSYR